MNYDVLFVFFFIVIVMDVKYLEFSIFLITLPVHIFTVNKH